MVLQSVKAVDQLPYVRNVVLLSDIQYLPLDVEAMLQARQFSQSTCLDCVAMTELCPACQDLRDVRDVEIAHEIVDSPVDYITLTYQGTVLKWLYEKDVATPGTAGEKRPNSVIRPQPSGHDWTEREGEILEPISKLEDRTDDLETRITILPTEVLCSSCHLYYNKSSSDCPVCY